MLKDFFFFRKKTREPFTPSHYSCIGGLERGVYETFRKYTALLLF